MCIEILYTFCGLYASYCCCFCSAMAHTLYIERQQRRRQCVVEQNDFSEFS